MTSRNNGLALLVIATAQLLIVMDGTIVTVGLPVIGAGLNIAESDLDWILTSYAPAPACRPARPPATPWRPA